MTMLLVVWCRGALSRVVRVKVELPTTRVIHGVVAGIVLPDFKTTTAPDKGVQQRSALLCQAQLTTQRAAGSILTRNEGAHWGSLIGSRLAFRHFIGSCPHKGCHRRFDDVTCPRKGCWIRPRPSACGYQHRGCPHKGYRCGCGVLHRRRGCQRHRALRFWWARLRPVLGARRVWSRGSWPVRIPANRDACENFSSFNSREKTDVTVMNKAQHSGLAALSCPAFKPATQIEHANSGGYKHG